MSDEPIASSPETEPVLALVTGGARRLGAEIVRALVHEGFDVAFTFHRSGDAAEDLVEELTDTGAQVGAYETDLRSATAIDALVEAVESDMGPIGLLVNNAGLMMPGDVETASDVDFDACMTLNVRAPHLLSLSVGRRMRARGEGAIVNVASTGGIRPYARHLAYSISKAGVIMATRAMALALAPEVTVNAVAPGMLWLDESDDEGFARPHADRIPAQAYGDADDVTDAVLYLATAPYVTGQVLPVDGGWSLRG